MEERIKVLEQQVAGLMALWEHTGVDRSLIERFCGTVAEEIPQGCTPARGGPFTVGPMEGVTTAPPSPAEAVTDSPDEDESAESEAEGSESALPRVSIPSSEKT